jgi:hypothetical protein
MCLLAGYLAIYAGGKFQLELQMQLFLGPPSSNTQPAQIWKTRSVGLPDAPRGAPGPSNAAAGNAGLGGSGGGVSGTAASRALDSDGESSCKRGVVHRAGLIEGLAGGALGSTGSFLDPGPQ